MERRVRWIDAVKGIAITGVVLIHSGFEPSLPAVLSKVASVGDKGVQAFLIISAYLLYLSYGKHFAEGGSYFGWLKKKWVRIAPLYYLAIVISLVFVGGFISWTGDVGKITIWNVISHFLFLHGCNPTHMNSILGVEWYLADYAILVAVIPILYKVINSFSRALAFFAGSSVVCYFITYAARYFPMISNEKLWGTFIDSFWFPTQLPVMALGIVLYYLTVKLESTYEVKGNKLLSYTLLLGSAYFLMILIADAGYKGVSIYVPYSLAIIGVIISQLIWRCPLVVNSFWCMLGKHSYIIYLFHRIFFSLYEKIWGQYYDFSLIAWALKFVVVFIVSVVFSIMLDTVIEKVKKHMQQR